MVMELNLVDFQEIKEWVKLDLTISKSLKLQLINLIFGTSQSINLTPLKKQFINTVSSHSNFLKLMYSK